MINFKKITQIGILPADDENMIHQKQFLVAEGVLMSCGGLMWGTIVILLDRKIQSLVPYGYCVLTIFNLIYFSRSKNFPFVRNFQTSISLILPFLFQASLGGFHASGGVMLWGLLAVAASLSFQNIKQSLYWLVFYLLLTISMGFLDSAFINWIHPNTPTNISMILYTLNILLVSAIIFSLLLFYLIQNNAVIEQKLIIEQQKQFKERFLANMSHEIRTPINAIMGMTNLTLNSPVSPKQKEYLTVIKKSSENLLVIINDILDLSKLEAGKMELEKIHFRLIDVIHQVYFSMKLKAEENGLELTTHIESDVPAVILGDPYRLNQILMNLVGNAIKFTSKGYVKIKVEQERGGAIKFRVIDSGVGIPKDKIKLLFENFSQADSSTTRKFGGTGLGLSISKTLIDLQNGTIEVLSEEGKGSEFTFTIPFQSGEENKVELNDIDTIDNSSLSGIRILVAEDNEYNQMVIKDTLESLIDNTTLHIANNGKIAIEKLLANEYDLILMDIQMPIMDGIESTKYIRENMHDSKKEIPILALTASILEKDINRFLSAGMNDCIPKPFTSKELIFKLAQYYKKEKNIISETHNLNHHNNGLLKEKESDLTFLKEFCEEDETRMKKYISMFLSGMPENIKKIEEAFNKQDVSAVAKIAHTIKPQFNYMGIKRGKSLSDTIENYSANGINPEQMSLLIMQLKEVCEKSYIELNN